MSDSKKYDRLSKQALFTLLRREILAARLKVTLDEQLNRETSPTVKRLAQMKLPRIPFHGGEVPNRRTYELSHKDQVFDTLRREILAAQLKVTLDEQLNRETSPTVLRLSKMKLPSIRRRRYHHGNVHADAIAQKAADIRAGRRKTIPAAEVRRELGLEG